MSMSDEEPPEDVWPHDEEVPDHDMEKFIAIYTCWCPHNCGENQTEYVCSKGMTYLGYFESVQKAQTRVCNHCSGQCHNFAAEGATKKLITERPHCIKGSFWQIEQWREYVAKVKSDIEKKKASQKRAKATSSAALRATAEPRERDGPYVKQGGGAPRRPPGSPPDHLLRRGQARPSSYDRGGVANAAAAAVHAGHAGTPSVASIVDSGNDPLMKIHVPKPPPQMSGKNILLEALTKAEAALRCAARFALFCYQAYTAEADNLANANLGFASHAWRLPLM